MKFLFSILFVIESLATFGQTRQIDSLKRALTIVTVDSNKAKILWKLSDAYLPFKPDTSITLAQQGLAISKKIKYAEGKFWCLNEVANALSQMGDYPKALKFFLDQLKLAESDKSVRNIAVANMNICIVYAQQGEYRKAVSYASTAQSLIEKNELVDLESYNCINLGDMYEKMNVLDSAMYFTNRAYELVEQQNDNYQMGLTLNNLANICSKNGKTDLAFKNYRKALPLLQQVKADSYISEASLGLARLYNRSNQRDSALHYATRSFNIAASDGLLEQKLQASIFLANVYKSEKRFDSAFVYQEQMLATKDSIHSAESIKQTLLLTSAEQLRQQEIKDRKIREEEERHKTLQLTLAGVFLPLFFLLLAYLRRGKIKPRVIEVAGIVSLLLFFEYLTLLLHPIVLEKTHHMPILELVVFVVLASILSPAHHRMEHWLLHKLSNTKHQNKQL
jgi:tetratricopeptide (TPR) repeat protein